MDPNRHVILEVGYAWVVPAPIALMLMRWFVLLHMWGVDAPLGFGIHDCG